MQQTISKRTNKRNRMSALPTARERHNFGRLHSVPRCLERFIPCHQTGSVKTEQTAQNQYEPQEHVSYLLRCS